MDDIKAEVKLNEKLAHLTEQEVNTLMNRYYNNNKAKDLVEEYKIDINPSKLYTLFPPTVCDEKLCPYCANPLLIKRPSKSSYSFNTNNAYCINCGHEDSMFCNCTHCQEKKRIAELKKEEEQKKIAQRKRVLINETYNLNKYKPVKINELTLRDKVYLGALLRIALTEDMKKIKPLEYVERTLAPTLGYTKEILRALIYKNIILVSPDSKIEAFPDSSDEIEFPHVYYINKVSYVLNIDFEENYEKELAILINPSEINEEDKNEALKIWQDISLEECLEYLNYQMDKVKFEFNAGEKTIAIFKDLLQNFSVCQIYGIIYRSIANATKYYQETDISRKQAANSVVGNCQRYGERAIIEKWQLSKYNRVHECPQSMISEFFFNRITKIGELGFEMPPIIL
ncbi:hypothetical protein CPJCM30710_19710 [Clostridium polyendosporum]|uniref:Uncharacterized protein n=1 Tax=Clostridium polyendosporum TaxID=69208 RepID=A0A919S191_9CLOT|nr:hypothetical protein [Clostridium polyendosporum]GIM29305.1 hypothetical protein CPJCM30710_19710 [Clostridium polyendosporum]